MTIHLKRSLVFLFLFLTTLLFSSCATTKVFEKNGIHLVLDSSFKEMEANGQDLALISKSFLGLGGPTSLIVALREPPNNFFSITTTVYEYARLVIYANGLSETTKVASIYNEEGTFLYVAFGYTKIVDGDNYNYLATCWKTQTAFYLIQFAGLEKDYEKLVPKFDAWAMAITVD